MFLRCFCETFATSLPFFFSRGRGLKELVFVLLGVLCFLAPLLSCCAPFGAFAILLRRFFDVFRWVFEDFAHVFTISLR